MRDFQSHDAGPIPARRSKVSFRSGWHGEGLRLLTGRTRKSARIVTSERSQTMHRWRSGPTQLSAKQFYDRRFESCSMLQIWGCSANGNTPVLQAGIGSSILSISTMSTRIGITGSPPGWGEEGAGSSPVSETICVQL